MKPATIRKIFLLGTVSLALLFTSCENFLKAQDTANQIREAIEIANSNPITIYIEAEKDSGTVTPAQVRVKKHETFEMKFSPSDNWKFIGWEVLDRTTMEPVADAIMFDDATKLEVKASFVKPAENLVIRPKCLLLPAITSSTPGAAQASYANTPIKITFNMPMEDESVTAEDSLFKYGPQNIYISYGSVYMAEYFEEPRFNSDKTVLTLTPKASALQSFIATENKPFIDVQVSFGGKIIVKNGENELSMANTAQEITARYRKDTESTPPEKYAFYAAADSDYSTHFTQAALSTFTNTEILQNRANGKIYIYGRYYDADSGVNTITLTEKHTNARDGSLAPVTQDPVYFTAANANFTDDGNGTTTFCIEYDLKSDDGAILISITVSDGCDISAPEETFTVIKDSVLDLSGVELWNFRPSNESDKYFTHDGKENGVTIQYEEWPSIIKNVKLNAIKKQIYKDCYLPETSLKTVSITYNSVPHDMNYDSNSEIWNYVINDVSDFSGLELTLTIEDDFNHLITKKFSYPDVPKLINIGEPSYYPVTINGITYNQNQPVSYTVDFSTESIMTQLVEIYDYEYYQNDVNLYNYRSYILNENDSLSIIMEMTHYNTPDYVRKDLSVFGENHRFFLLNGLLAGNLTNDISYRNAKTVNNTLSPVKVEEADMIPSDDGELLIISGSIDMANNPWETYDNVIVKCSIGPGRFIVTSFLPRNSSTFTVSIPYTTKRYLGGNYIKLSGINETSISPEFSYSDGENGDWYYLGYPASNPTKYEKIKPKLLTDYPQSQSISAIYKTLDAPKRYDYMIPVLASDLETSSPIKKVIVNANGKIWSYAQNSFLNLPDGVDWEGSGTGKNIAVPPVWDADQEVNNLTIKYYDKYDNCAEWSGTYTSLKLRKLVWFLNNDGKYIFSTRQNEQLYQWRLGVAKWDSTNGWVRAISDVTTQPLEAYYNGSYVYQFTEGVELPANSFVKVYATAASEDDWSSTSFGHSSPTYIYTGSYTMSGDYEYISPKGSSKSEVFVISDAPTFVHTIVTKYPLSECKNWTVEQWEHNHKHFGDKYMEFTANPTAKKYTIPIDSIDTGDCYVVIAHFADGSYDISEVMQK